MQGFKAVMGYEPPKREEFKQGEYELTLKSISSGWDLDEFQEEKAKVRADGVVSHYISMSFNIKGNTFISPRVTFWLPDTTNFKPGIEVNGKVWTKEEYDATLEENQGKITNMLKAIVDINNDTIISPAFIFKSFEGKSIMGYVKYNVHKVEDKWVPKLNESGFKEWEVRDNSFKPVTEETKKLHQIDLDTNVDNLFDDM